MSVSWSFKEQIRVYKKYSVKLENSIYFVLYLIMGLFFVLETDNSLTNIQSTLKNVLLKQSVYDNGFTSAKTSKSFYF
jgi:hypothetical protein